MELFTALSEAERTSKSQFNEAPNTDHPESDDTRRSTIGTVVRHRLSAGLYGLARAIEPSEPQAGMPSLKT